MFTSILKPTTLKNDVLSGLTVALALVPEAVAFALVAGVNPLVGLYAAFIVGLVAASIGGRPGMISGATGALAVVMVSLVANHGVNYLFLSVILMGFIQILAGVARLGKFIRMVPHPVMLGFVNGLAIVIFLAQFQNFKTTMPTGEVIWLQGIELYTMLGLVGLTMAIVKLLPLLTKMVPSTLVAILVVSGITNLFSIETKTVGDIASIAGTLPTFNIPDVPFNLETLKIILPYSFIFAAIGLIESLLTLQLIDEVTETTGKSNKECIGQGTANIITGFFGGMGGCAMLGQSMINISSGGHGRMSGIVAALFLLSFILFGAPLIQQIPIAALVGVMFIVVIGTFEWSSLRILNKIPRSDAIVLVLVSGMTVLTDLAIAVVIGVIISALVFAWRMASDMNANIYSNDNGSKVYELHGPLFFSSVKSFTNLFTIGKDPQDIIIDFRYTRVYDMSGIKAIDLIAERFANAGKKLHLVHLSPECIKLFTKAGNMVEVNISEDPHYHVPTDRIL